MDYPSAPVCRGRSWVRRPTTTSDSLRRLINTLAAAVALYGFAAWVYVVIVSFVTPDVLPIQLTHLARWPRTDTFGEWSFAASFVGFVIWRLTRPVDG